jgi:hypothetical protein
MDELLKELERFKDMTSAFTLADVAIVLALSFVLSALVAAIYRYTHRGTSYAQSFAHTLVIMGMVTSLVMLIIGSNIARAFTLVGALSVIRFRNAVKETRDVGFMFFAMAVGMATGTRFYMLAAFATSAVGAAIILMTKLDLFHKRVSERVLRVRLPADVDEARVLDAVFREHLEESRLVSVETVAGGVLQEVVYAILPKPKTVPQTFLEAIRAVNGNNKVVLIMGQQEVDL